MGTLVFEDSDAKSVLLLNRVLRVGTDQTGQFLATELGLRHAPLTIKDSGCNANAKTASTPRERLQDKVGVGQICVYETFIFGPRQTRPF